MSEQDESEVSAQHWLIGEFERARARNAQVPSWARPVLTHRTGGPRAAAVNPDDGIEAER